jgi:hypothetical protein
MDRRRFLTVGTSLIAAQALRSTVFAQLDKAPAALPPTTLYNTAPDD